MKVSKWILSVSFYRIEQIITFRENILTQKTKRYERSCLMLFRTSFIQEDSL